MMQLECLDYVIVKLCLRCRDIRLVMIAYVHYYDIMMIMCKSQHMRVV